MRNRLPFAVVSWNPPSYLFSSTLFYDHSYYLIVDTNTSVKITSTDKHRHSREAQTPKPRWHLVCLCSRSELLTEVFVILSISIHISNIPTTSIMIMTVLTLFKFTLFIEVGSNTVVTGGDGAKYRGREYPWGTGRHYSSSWLDLLGLELFLAVNIEDSNHCDFMALRNLVLAHHMQDLKEANLLCTQANLQLFLI